MKHDAQEILAVLDRCSDACSFPALDNGYVYLAATRLSLHRSENDWALTIEVFGFSPRAGLPDTCVSTFASRLHERNPPENYVNRQAYESYLANNPQNESRFFFPIEQGDWRDEDNGEFVAADVTSVALRGRPIQLPTNEQCRVQDIDLVDPPQLHVFELCRYLAAIARDDVLATQTEQRVSVRPEMTRILTLDDWHHPNVVNATARPSASETFQQLARVLETGDIRLYRPTQPPNTHWRNWPDGGSL